MFNNIKRILCLAPHTDDIEFGCGASIYKFIKMGIEVYYIAFSTCEKSIPEGFPKNIAEIEVKKSTEILGIKSENLIILNYEVREFKRDRQLILEDLIKIRNEISPDLVFLPMLEDIHQDHHTISEEGIRAFKKSIVLGYEVPWNNLSIHNNLFIEIQKEDLEKKIESLKAYESQYFRSYATEEYIKSLAIVRGVQGRSEYAESFSVIRMYI